MNTGKQNIDINTIQDENLSFLESLINEEDKEKLFSELNRKLHRVKQDKSKEELYTVITQNNKEKLENYSKKVFTKIYQNKNINDQKAQEWMKLFQTAFLEMEWILWSIPRSSWDWKTYFDHVLWVLDNILAWPNPTIDKCIIAILHDSIEDIPWYTAQHIKEVYGAKIANSVNNMSKEPLKYYINMGKYDDIELNKLEDAHGNELINEITRQTRRDYYYGNIKNWENDEIDVKFADRLNSLETMYYYDEKTRKQEVDKKYLIKKMGETEKYFLIPDLKSKVSDFHYKKLEDKYFERKEKMDNWKI